MHTILATTAPTNSIVINESAYWGPYFVRENRGGGNLELVDADGDVTLLWVDYDELVTVCKLDATESDVADFA